MARRLTQSADFGVLARCAPEMATAMVALANDIALVIDRDGKVTAVRQNPQALVAPDAAAWVGSHWVETVTPDTRRKIESMLDELLLAGIARRREVSIPIAGGDGIPVAYTALRLGADGPTLAVGRDLRELAAIQQRYLDAQQEIERGYWRARQNESGYWLLFQVAADAVMTVEGQSLRIVEANHAAIAMFGRHGGALAGREAAQMFAGDSVPVIADLLAAVRTGGRPAEAQAQLVGTLLPVIVSAASFSVNSGLRMLLRVRAAAPAVPILPLNAALLRLLDGSSDGVVVTDATGHVLVANTAFVQLVGAASEAELHGQALSAWVGRVASDVPALLTSVFEHGIARLVHSVLQRRAAAPIDVDVSAALLADGDQRCFGFTVRPCAQTAPPTPVAEGLDEPLGSAPLAELLRRAEQQTRARLVRRALEQTAGDGPQAARMLGISTELLEQLRRDVG